MTAVFATAAWVGRRRPANQVRVAMRLAAHVAAAIASCRRCCGSWWALRNTLDAQPVRLGTSAGGHLDAASAAGARDGAHQRTSGQVGERGPSDRCVRPLIDRQRFAGQHRLGALQPVDLQQPNVIGNDVTETQLQNVARDDFSTSTSAGCPSRMTTLSW
jgi:hypothetical protein